MRRVRVVTVDDQPVFRDAARAIIEHTPEFQLVGEADEGTKALDVIREADPDLVLLDVRLPGLDRIEVSKRVAEEDPERVIVLVSSADPRELSPLAKNSGAAALLRKHCSTARLLARLCVA